MCHPCWHLQDYFHLCKCPVTPVASESKAPALPASLMLIITHQPHVKENLPKASGQEQHLWKSKCLCLHRVKTLISSLKGNAKRSTKINSSIKQQERSKAVGGSSSENDLNPRGICADAAQLHKNLTASRTTRDTPTNREANLGEASFFLVKSQ